MLAVVVLALSVSSWLLPVESGVRQVVITAVVAAFAISELLGGIWHRKMSLRWLVPTELVNSNDSVAATRWGRSLGFGFLTDAPYGVFHVALAIPVIAGSVGGSLAAVGAFASARALPYLIKPIGSNASEIADYAVKGRSILFRAARFTSFLSLAATLVWMLQ
ncbi:hypothetical protein [Sinosporangium siamense]|uniref:Uncharacterized protein n=1 Tax=Sinosporangium siamense TaxID=1367973 RepID=A0A919V4H9_9ACTN|nr:hypothetical protein [Sinosporangium siamense]GII91965.1 hypothetical protein Ssi02_21960 [Sinosporangium siamense]